MPAVHRPWLKKRLLRALPTRLPADILYWPQQCAVFMSYTVYRLSVKETPLGWWPKQLVAMHAFDKTPWCKSLTKFQHELERRRSAHRRQKVFNVRYANIRHDTREAGD